MWVKRTLAVGAVFAAVLGCAPEERERAAVPEAAPVRRADRLPQVNVRAPGKPPAVDGSLADAAWRKAPVLKTAYIWGGDEPPKQKTEIRLLADGTALYVAFTCFESRMNELVADRTERDSELWQDDVVELFLSPGSTPSDAYYHVLVNAAGTVADERYRDPAAWDAQGLEAAVKRLEDRWVVELVLPWNDVSAEKARPPAKWRANFNRTRQAKGSTYTEDQAWSPTLVETSHVPERFGHLTVEALEAAK